MPYPSAAQVLSDVDRVLKHFDDAEAILCKKINALQKQVEWVENLNDNSEAPVTILNDLESKIEILKEKLDSTRSLYSSIREYFSTN